MGRWQGKGPADAHRSTPLAACPELSGPLAACLDLSGPREVDGAQMKVPVEEVRAAMLSESLEAVAIHEGLPPALDEARRHDFRRQTSSNCRHHHCVACRALAQKYVAL